MPIDATIPLGFQQPNAMQNISQLLGIKSALLSQQQAEIANQGNSALLGERNSLRSLAQDPRVQDANGNVDPAKFATLAPQVAPTLGGDVSRSITGAQTASADNAQKWYQLQQHQSDKAYEIAGGFVNDKRIVDGKDGKAVADAIGDAEDQMVNAGVPKSLVRTQTAPLYLAAAKDPASVRPALMNIIQARIGSQAQLGAATPNVSLVPTAAGTLPYNTNANAPGGVGPVGQPLAPPNQVIQTTGGGAAIGNPATGLVHDFQSTGPVVNFPVGETADTQKALQDQRMAAQTQVVQAGTLHDINRTIVDEASKGLNTGTLGQLTQKVASATGFNVANESSTGYNLLGKMLERSALAAAQGMGPQTNAGLEAQIKANGSLEYTPQTIVKIAKLNDALVTGQQKYQSGLEAAIANSPDGVFAKRKFDQQWGANADPVALRFLNAAAQKNESELEAIIKEVGGRESKGFANLQARLGALRNLSRNGAL